MLLKPWNDAQKKVPGRFRSHWNRTLDNVSKKRSRLYRRAMKHKNTAAKEAYHMLDRNMKRQISTKKRNLIERGITSMSGARPRDIIKVAAGVLRLIGGRREQYQNKPVPREFTLHMDTRPGEGFVPETKRFEPLEDFAKLITKSVGPPRERPQARTRSSLKRCKCNRVPLVESSVPYGEKLGQ